MKIIIAVSSIVVCICSFCGKSKQVDPKPRYEIKIGVIPRVDSLSQFDRSSVVKYAKHKVDSLDSAFFKER